VLHSFPLVEALEFKASSPAIVPLLCGPENHDIASSALPVGRFLILDLIEHEHLLVVGGSVVFQILRSLLIVQFGRAVVGVSYITPIIRSRLGVAFNAIHIIYQPNMNLKTNL
jgi:hypothetical protein